MKKILFILLLMKTISGTSQNDLSCINLGEVQFKKIREFVDIQRKNNIIDFSDVEGSFSEAELSTYKKHKKTYLVDMPIEEAWNKYLTTSPAVAWNGKMVRFGFLFSKKTNQIAYQKDNFESLEEGQVIYVNIKLLKGFYNLAAAFEVTNVSDSEKLIEYNYVKGGNTQGKQWMKMESTKDGKTIISHYTLYKSASEFRDNFLYPYVHTLAITEYHRSIINY